MTLLDGLEDGRWALVTKTHHCLVDGVASVDVGTTLLDASPQPTAPLPQPPPDTEEVGERGSGRFWLSPGLVARGARAGVGAALHPRDSFDRAPGRAGADRPRRADRRAALRPERADERHPAVCHRAV